MVGDHINMEVYKITSKNQWNNCSSIFIYFVLTIAMTCYFIYIQDVSDKVLPILFFSVFFLAQLIPLLALHLNYYSVNKRDILTFNPINREINFSHYDKDVTFDLDDIDHIIVYKSYALKFKAIQFFSFDDYNHAVISINNGNKIVITSLLTGGEFAFPVPKDKVIIKANFYRWATGPSLQLK